MTIRSRHTACRSQGSDAAALFAVPPNAPHPSMWALRNRPPKPVMISQRNKKPASLAYRICDLTISELVIFDLWVKSQRTDRDGFGPAAKDPCSCVSLRSELG